MFDAIFLDADNTLFDFDQTQKNSLASTLTQFELPADEAARTLFERINHACWQRYDRGEIANEQINELRWQLWLDQIGRRDAPLALVAAHYVDQLAQQCEKEPGADDLLTALSAHCPLHIITNGFPATQAHRWRKANWLSQLQGITVSAVVGVQKPEAGIYQQAMAAVGVAQPQRCLMIGDNLVADVQGAQAIGMQACWYQRGDQQNNTEIKPDFVVTHLADLPALLGL